MGQYNIMFCHCIQSSSKAFDLPPPPLSSIYRSKSFRARKPRPYTTTKPLQRVHLDHHIRRYSFIRPIFVGQRRNPIKAQQIDRKITDCFDAGYTHMRVCGGVFYFILVAEFIIISLFHLNVSIQTKRNVYYTV